MLDLPGAAQEHLSQVREWVGTTDSGQAQRKPLISQAFNPTRKRSPKRRPLTIEGRADSGSVWACPAEGPKGRRRSK